MIKIVLPNYLCVGENGLKLRNDSWDLEYLVIGVWFVTGWDGIEFEGCRLMYDKQEEDKNKPV